MCILGALTLVIGVLFYNFVLVGVGCKTILKTYEFVTRDLCGFLMLGIAVRGYMSKPTHSQ